MPAPDAPSDVCCVLGERCDASNALAIVHTRAHTPSDLPSPGIPYLQKFHCE